MPDFTPLERPFYIGFPDDWIAWSGWLVLAALVAWGVYHFWERGRKWTRRDWILLVALAGATVLFSLLFGIRLPATELMPLPGRPEEPRGPVLMFLIAVPWMLAGCTLGTGPAVLLGMLSGLLLGFADTHSLYTPVEMAGLALVFSAAVQQRYRTLFYKTIRHPFGAAVLVFVLYIPIYLISISVATSQYSLVVRVDYALTNLRAAALAVGAELGLAGMLVEVLTLAIPSIWGKTEPLKPSPVESQPAAAFLLWNWTARPGPFADFNDWRLGGRRRRCAQHAWRPLSEHR